MITQFKHGDRVQLRSGGPVMKVIKHESRKKPLKRANSHNPKVLCQWYDKRLGKREFCFHQRDLKKSLLPANTFLKREKAKKWIKNVRSADKNL